MMKTITSFMKFSISAFVAIIILSAAASTFAWTRARLSNVDVSLQIHPTDESTFTTNARFEVSGGQFHGFDLAPQADSTLIPEECYARIEGGLRVHVKVKELFDGRTRIVLANKESVRDGAVVFTLVHKTNLQETGALRKHDGRARLDWTPIIWDHGTDAMSVQVMLPETSNTFDYENEATRDYEVADPTRQSVTFKKTRTVKWYPMQVVVDFDKEIVLLKNTPEADNATAEIEEKSQSAAMVNPPEKVPPFWVSVMPSAIALVGLFLMIVKVRGVQRIHADVGVASRFKLLKHTGFLPRFLLSLLALALATIAQFFGSNAASVLPLAVAAALWLIERSEGALIPRPGGKWRSLSGDEVIELRKVLAAYKRRRFSFLDITYGLGAIAFIAACAGIIYCAWLVKTDFPKAVWGIAISGIIWMLPIWFSFTHAELPVDPTIESFQMLKKWKRGLSKLVGKLNPDAEASFWIREDEQGPVEIRLRVHPAPAELTGLEIATEVIKAQTSHKVRKVAILKMYPGTDAARKLAACPNAAEHHLTPDLQEEIIVLRNRRGKRDAGFAPLRQALSLIRG